MFLCRINPTKSPFKVGHLFEHESAIGQTPKRFFVRLERSLEVAQDAIAINALREPCFPELGLECDRAIRLFFYLGTRVRLRIDAVETKLACR